MQPQNDHQTRGDKINQRKRQQELPAESHQLVIAETGQRATRPNVKEQQQKNFAEKPERALNHRHDSRPGTKIPDADANNSEYRKNRLGIPLNAAQPADNERDS